MPSPLDGVTPRHIVRWFLQPVEERASKTQELLALIGHADREVAHRQLLVEEFLILVRTLQGTELEPWLERVKATGARELRQFAHGLERDKAAVVAGLTLPYSTGPVEGHINRLKLLKRQSYGRAGVAHLSKTAGCIRLRSEEYMDSQEARHAHPWRAVEELIDLGYQRSRVIMMNECHAGWFRCIRTRSVGQRLLPTAHRLGVRSLAMEALYPAVVEEANASRRLPPDAWGYLAQPAMRELMQSALDLGWRLIAYEAIMGQVPTGLDERATNNWREEQQARNLIAALAQLPEEERLLVWCGNNHHSKALVPVQPGDPDVFWGLMGYHFSALSGCDPFVIDQGRTVRFPGMPRRPAREQWLEEIAPILLTLGGTAGFLREEAPSCFAVGPGDDAYLVSLDNEMEELDPGEHS